MGEVARAVVSIFMLVFVFFPTDGFAVSMLTISQAKMEVQNPPFTTINRLLRFKFSYVIDPSADTDITVFLPDEADPSPIDTCGPADYCWEISLKNFIGPAQPALVVGGISGLVEDFVILDLARSTLAGVWLEIGSDCATSDSVGVTCSVPRSAYLTTLSPTGLSGSGVFGVVPLPAAGLLSGASVAALLLVARRRDRGVPASPAGA